MLVVKEKNRLIYHLLLSLFVELSSLKKRCLLNMSLPAVSKCPSKKIYINNNNIKKVEKKILKKVKGSPRNLISN